MVYLLFIWHIKPNIKELKDDINPIGYFRVILYTKVVINSIGTAGKLC